MRVLLLVNDVATSVTARTRVMIHTALSERFETEVAATNRRGHAARLARGAAVTGTDAVVVLGGDGTLNEAANGVAGTDCVLAALPGGATNVFARTIGTVDDPLAATAQVIASLTDRSVVSAGLGRTGGRFFLFHCGIGLDAAIVARVERHPMLKRCLGHLLFLLSGAATLARRSARGTGDIAFRASWGTRGQAAGRGPVEVDGCYLVVAVNTDPYTFLGSRPVSIAPNASLPEGLAGGLSVVGLRSLRPGDALVVLRAVFGSSGDLSDLGTDVVARCDDVRWLSVCAGNGSDTQSSGQPFLHQVDGDYCGEVDSLEIEWVPEMLRLAVPAGPAGNPP